MDLTLIEMIVKAAMIVMAVLLALNLYVRAKILKVLRDSHEAVWKKLGSPSLVLNSSFQNGMAMLRFIWGRRQRTLKDAALDQLVRMERRLHVIQGVVLFLALLLMVSTLFLR